MSMTDEELDYWGRVGDSVNWESPTWGHFPGGDIIRIWNALGAIVQRLDLNLEPPTRNPLDVDKERKRMADLRREIEGLKL